MGVDTKAYLRNGVTVQEIEQALAKKYKEVNVIRGNETERFWFVFNDGNDKRTLWVSFNDYSDESGIKGVYCSLGFWNNSVEILKYLCETFGGYLDENDCDEEGFYPINPELFVTGKDMSKRDYFVMEVISAFGYENLNKALNLFDKYLTVNATDLIKKFREEKELKEYERLKKKYGK